MQNHGLKQRVGHLQHDLQHESKESKKSDRVFAGMVKALVQAQQLFGSSTSTTERQKAVNQTITAALSSAIAGKVGQCSTCTSISFNYQTSRFHRK